MTNKIQLPEILDGHWSTPEGAEMAERYAAQSRKDLGLGHRSDMSLAYDIYMMGAPDIMLQTAIKDRIRWLSAHLALAKAQNAVLLDALQLARAHVAADLRTMLTNLEHIDRLSQTKSQEDDIATGRYRLVSATNAMLATYDAAIDAAGGIVAGSFDELEAAGSGGLR